jgi:SAM-dependent methyltransferase
MAEQSKNRIYGAYADIDSESVKSFWNNNARKDSSLKSVLLGNDFGENSAILHNERENKILRSFVGDKSISILDIGCGIGRWAYNLKPIIKVYHGIDFSDEFVKSANIKFNNSANIKFYCMSATNIDTSVLLSKYDLVISSEVSMYINDKDLEQLYATVNNCTSTGSSLYLQDTTSLMETRLTLKDFDSKELQTKYNAIYRTQAEYENLFKNYLPYFELASNGSALLLDKESGARDETNARYWFFRKK